MFENFSKLSPHFDPADCQNWKKCNISALYRILVFNETFLNIFSIQSMLSNSRKEWKLQMLCCLFNQLFFSFPLWYYYALKLFTWHHMVTLAILPRMFFVGCFHPSATEAFLINCTSCFHPFWVGKRGFVLFFRSLNNEKFNEAPTPIGRSVKNLPPPFRLAGRDKKPDVPFGARESLAKWSWRQSVKHKKWEDRLASKGGVLF